jgi:hypothetical protein
MPSLENEKQAAISGRAARMLPAAEVHMETTAKGWNVLDRDSALLSREYSFGAGVATTFVFRGAGDGNLMRHVDLQRRHDVAALDELTADFRKVVALVANNGYHWLGQALA